MKSKETKEKPVPVRCVCGAEAATVIYRGKKWLVARIRKGVMETSEQNGEGEWKKLLLIGTA